MTQISSLPRPPLQSSSRRSIAVDIGNSRIKFGLLSLPENGKTPNGSKTNDAEFPELEDSFFVKHGEEIPWDRIRNWATSTNIEADEIAVAGVNPPALDRLLADWSKQSLPQPVVIDRPDQLDLSVLVETPGKVGIDRLLNGVAGNRVRSPGQPLIVLTSGTAGTIDLLDTSGTFVGGSIFSGLEMTARSLHDYTAQLPLLTVEELRTDFPSPLGKNTRDAMHAGIFWGHVGAVRELISRMAEPFEAPPALIVTGGAARMLVPHLPPHARWIPHLVLYGLAITISRRHPAIRHPAVRQ